MSPKNATEIGQKRHYRVPGTVDTLFPSVTTILGAYPKEWLGAWAAKMVAELAVETVKADDPFGTWAAEGRALMTPKQLKENPSDRDAALKFLKGYPWRKRDEAADHGTEVHETFERMNIGDGAFDVPPSMVPHIGRIEQWVEAYQPEVLWSECQVYNRAEGYAGTFDLFANVQGRNVLIDLKTSKEASIDSWTLQLAAYGFTDLIADGDVVLDQPIDIPWPDAYAVLWVPRDKPDHWQFIELPVSSFAYETFLALKEIYRWRESKPSGQLILPPAREEIVA